MRVLVATDGSEAGSVALDWAMRLFPGAELHVVAVADVPPAAWLPPFDPPLGGAVLEALWAEAQARAEAAVAQARRRLAEAGACPVRTYVRQGEVTRAVVDLARGLRVDLIVVGSRSHGWLARRLYGSVADAVRRKFPGAVLVARAPCQAAGVYIN